MNRILFALLLLCPSLSFAQEAWIDDVPVIDEPVTPEVDPLEERIAALEANMTKTVENIDGIVESLGGITKALKTLVEKPVASAIPGQCECNCECPGIDEIRQVVREEIDRVTVTLKNDKGETKQVELPLTKTQPIVSELQPGDRVVAIDGQPVIPFTYGETKQGSVTQYTTPRYDMRVLNSNNGGYFGAVRATNTCRMVNGVKVCN